MRIKPLDILQNQSLFVLFSSSTNVKQNQKNIFDFNPLQLTSRNSIQASILFSNNAFGCSLIAAWNDNKSTVYGVSTPILMDKCQKSNNSLNYD
jgi:hypothetical protein